MCRSSDLKSRIHTILTGGVMKLPFYCSALAAVFVFAMSGFRASAEPCESPQHHQLDFWLGEWLDEASGERNFYRVRKVAGGCGVEEVLIDGRDRSTVLGEGLSGYDGAAKIWHQQWVDSGGQVFEYTGEPELGVGFVFKTSPDSDGEIRRYRYLNITQAAIEADYYASRDGGVTWKFLWRGRFSRIQN
jgi:hypothetical protein